MKNYLNLLFAATFLVLGACGKTESVDARYSNGLPENGIVYHLSDLDDETINLLTTEE